ncbi:hypothetical protein CWATWH0402_4226 [Crocosphaera watsonii WH 0402]|uniref:Uncharacterized protein n=1 Tax=Crocosphaera watsonii WH 0402 TaxID=1284629 RepID=T2JWH5_CROWT|nr:hypothetical protein CWATWH0402_4226 [Crocosphaera watsonii WH 0402]
MIPTSIPNCLPVFGNGLILGSLTKIETNQRPDGSSLTVTVDG